MKKFLLVLVTALAVLLPSAPSQADTYFPNGTVRVERADRHVLRDKLKVTYVEAMKRKGFLYTNFNNGSLWYFAPCKTRDSRRCYWAHGDRPFIQNYGKKFYLN